MIQILDVYNISREIFCLQGIQLGTETVFSSFYSIGFYCSDRGIKHHSLFNFHFIHYHHFGESISIQPGNCQLLRQASWSKSPVVLQSSALYTREITRKIKHEEANDEMIELYHFLTFCDVLEVDISMLSIFKNTRKSLKGMLEDAWP